MPALHAGDGPMQDSTSCENRCIYCHMLYQMFDANILYGTHQKKKMTLTFGTFFCGTACAANRRLLLQIGRFLPRIGRFLPKKWKASTEECWVRTHISSETQWSFAYGSSGAVFVSSEMCLQWQSRTAVVW